MLRNKLRDFKKKKSSKIFIGILSASFVIFVIFWIFSFGKESTDASQIEGHIVTISPQISGKVVKIFVSDNQNVNEGDPLVELDSAQQKVEVALAMADLDAAKASFEQAEAELSRTDKNYFANLAQARGGLTQANSGIVTSAEAVKQAKANLDSAISAESLAKKNLERFLSLKIQGAVSQAELDNQQNQYEQARAALHSAQAQVASMQASRTQSSGGLQQAKGQMLQAEALENQVKSFAAAVNLAQAKVKRAEAALNQAELKLSYTLVKAPFSGTVSNKTVENGKIVQISSPLLSIVSLTDTWVVANFKENQLKNMRAGQKVKIKVDSYPSKTFTGVVKGLSGASGATFALLPPDNSSGNFVKVTQRFPVQIEITSRPSDAVLRPGMSTVVTVHTR
ncbi:HlyD family secretion protein [Fluviispira multicolorata]|uniref:HlyD family efflux transporter periplasmic adaptor subunit n=1 Tax=Fluviispira multicolorata TaxID=2654512 RepID=A0A833JF32_9BACT|nr:HlyD family secretion protein [Fluviispira multicolorata]KAB8032239.1 HlyD family efflux transporter periplasmic adaptor subunit [Fluviispira multicolorata]